MLPGSENAWDEIDSIAHGVSDVRDEVTGRSCGRTAPTGPRCGAARPSSASVAEEDES